MPRNNDIKKVLVIGSGPILIGMSGKLKPGNYHD